MSFRFEVHKSIHLLHFTLHSLGGRAPLHMLCGLLYLADVKHMVRYGMPALGDCYLSVKQSVMPVHIFSIYRELKEAHVHYADYNLHEHFSIINDTDIQCRNQYDESCIAASEALCIFEVIREYKKITPEELETLIRNHAWNHANRNNEVSYDAMATAAGISPAFNAYIKTNRADEIAVFHDNDEASGSRTNRNSLHIINRPLPGIRRGSILFYRDNGNNTGRYYLVAGITPGIYGLVRIYREGELEAEIREHPFLETCFSPLVSSSALQASIFADCSRIIFRHFRDMRIWMKKYPDSLVGELSMLNTGSIISTLGNVPTISVRIKKTYQLL